jgi:glycosyltransferase involved in cell wall biosynthesis
MTKDIPVVASRIPCFQEIFGNAPEYFDPTNEHDCARALILASRDESARTSMVQIGNTIPVRYNWKKSAEEYTNLFERLVNNKSDGGSTPQQTSGSHHA